MKKLILLLFIFCIGISIFSQERKTISKFQKPKLVYNFNHASNSILLNHCEVDVDSTKEINKIVFIEKYVFINKTKYKIGSIIYVEDCLEILVDAGPYERTIEICQDSIGNYASISSPKNSKHKYWKNFYNK